MDKSLDNLACVNNSQINHNLKFPVLDNSFILSFFVLHGLGCDVTDKNSMDTAVFGKKV